MGMMITQLKAAFNMMRKGQLAGGLIAVAVALIIGVIGLKIVSDVIDNSSFTGITSTVVTYITVGLAVTLLVVAFGAARRGE